MKSLLGYIIKISLKILICVVMTILVWNKLKKFEFFSGTSKTSTTDTISANVPQSTLMTGGDVVHRKKARKNRKKKTRKKTRKTARKKARMRTTKKTRR